MNYNIYYFCRLSHFWGCLSEDAGFSVKQHRSVEMLSRYYNVARANAFQDALRKLPPPQKAPKKSDYDLDYFFNLYAWLRSSKGKLAAE